jgi:electron transfer flavoprotein beta subunit
MDIVVCVKRVPDTREADLQISGDGKSINTKDLVFDVNDWDKYAVEEAVRLKEKNGGTVTVITMGQADSDDILRRCFATGADSAIRLTDPAFEESDAMAVASLLAGTLKTLKYDLVLFGAQAGDDGYGAVGQAAAVMLGLPYTSLAVKIDIQNNSLKAMRELEAGMHESLELPLPALVTIQTGINEPRYVSIMGIRKASAKEIRTPALAELSLSPDSFGTAGSKTSVEKLFVPPVLKQTEMLSGSLDEVSQKLALLLKEKGGSF